MRRHHQTATRAGQPTWSTSEADAVPVVLDNPLNYRIPRRDGTAGTFIHDPRISPSDGPTGPTTPERASLVECVR